MSLREDSSQAKTQLDSLFNECKGIFDYTKPIKLILRLLQICANSNDIVLDFFSGFRVIIMTQANSQVNTRGLELLPVGLSNICYTSPDKFHQNSSR